MQRSLTVTVSLYFRPLGGAFLGGGFLVRTNSPNLWSTIPLVTLTRIISLPLCTK